MEFFIARKVRPVFEVYRQVFHKVANSVRSSEPVLTSSFDISNLTGRPHPTIMKDIRKILEQGAGADDFFKTCRPVETECGMRNYEVYNITPKGLLILATGYAPLLRDRIAARFMEIIRGGNMETGIRPMPNPSCGNVLERMMPDYAKEYERRNAELWRIIEEKNRIIDGLRTGGQAARRMEEQAILRELRNLRKEVAGIGADIELAETEMRLLLNEFGTACLPSPKNR